MVVTLVLFASLGSQQGKPGDPMYTTTANDPVMNAAEAYARETLLKFWSHWQHPQQGETDFSLKVRVKERGDTEFFWVVDVSKMKGRVYGTINNDPEVVHSVHVGQRIPIHDTDIGDWCYLRNQKMVGNYTLRAALKSMKG